MLNPCLWEGENFGVRLKDLVVRVLYLNVLLLNDSFHALMVLEI